MSKTSYTALPWTVREAESQSGERFLAVGSLSAERSVARVSAVATLTDEDIANANFIAYACNAHYPLVTAAKVALRVLRSGDVLEQARAVNDLVAALAFTEALSPDAAAGVQADALERLERITEMNL